MRHSNNRAYLTKRLLKRAAREAGKEASAKAMEVAGHLVVVRENSVVRIYPDGREEHLKDLPPSIDISKVELD
jgi:hypothetical protein